MDTTVLLIANLAVVSCMSLERIFKAFSCNLHSISSIACSALCCSGEIVRTPTPPHSFAGSPTKTPTTSGAYEETKRRSHSLDSTLRGIILDPYAPALKMTRPV